MTTPMRIDPTARRLALQLAGEGKSLQDIGNATGLLDNEIRRIVDEARQSRAASPATPPTRRPAGMGSRPVVPPTPPPTARSAAIAGPPPSLETVRIAVGKLAVDEAYQRDVNLRWVLAKVKEYDRALLGVLEISDRGPNAPLRFAVVDGRHRLELVKAVEGDNASVLCHVHRGLTVEDEARLFGQIDAGRRRLSGWDRWKARRAAGDADVQAIEATVERAGLRLVSPGTPRDSARGVVLTTNACEQVVALGGLGLLYQTLIACVSAWGARESFSYDEIAGIANVLQVYDREELELDRLVESLASVLPAQLKARARARREVQKGTISRLVATVIVDLVNDNRGGRRQLEPFYVRVPPQGKTKTVTGGHV